MTVWTLATYLLGIRKAILEIATGRHAVWLGMLLVLSAALAREYDGQDLLDEPWHLVVPLGASLATSFVLYLLVYGAARSRGAREMPFLAGYRALLGLYWCTAPLAWLYAIPVERFLSPADATQANLWLLALVSAWRVALITRAISVLFGATLKAALMLVMLFADSLALIILFNMELPIISIMGGIRHSESERLILDAAFVVGAAGMVSWPVWFVGTLAVCTPTHRTWRFVPAEHPPSGSASRSLLALAVASLAVWGLVLPATQPEQQRRHRVEHELVSGRISQALQTMSAHRRTDFPPHWDPPPRIGYGSDMPPLLDVMEALVANEPAPWVRRIYVEKFRNAYLGQRTNLPDQVRQRIEAVLERIRADGSSGAADQKPGGSGDRRQANR